MYFETDQWFNIQIHIYIGNKRDSALDLFVFCRVRICKITFPLEHFTEYITNTSVIYYKEYSCEMAMVDIVDHNHTIISRWPTHKSTIAVATEIPLY